MSRYLLIRGVACLALIACSKAPAERKTPEPAVSSSAAAVASVEPVVSAAPPPTPPTPICRALRVTGKGRVGDAELVSDAALDGSVWVTLEKDASVTLKHSATGRELSISGPALFRACRRGREQLLLARGKVVGGGGVGARPGGEVSIATPVAGVRYADAELTVTLDDKQLSVVVRAGQVDIDSATEKELKSPLRPRDKLSVPLGKPDVTALMARCQEAAKEAETTARRVGDRNAPEPLGERAQANVRARKAARASCMVAAAATGLVADPSQSAGLWAEAARWEGLWESIPRRSHVQAPDNPAEK